MILVLFITSVNFPCVCVTFCQLQSTIRAAAGPSVGFLCISGTFHEYSVCLHNIPSTSVNFPCICRTFHQFSMRPRDLPSVSVNSFHFCWTFPSNFRVTAAPSINFPSSCGVFCQLPHIFRADAGLSIRARTFCNHSVQPRDLPSHSINLCQNDVSVRPSENILCGHWTFHQLPSTFCTSEGQSINYLCISGNFCELCQLSVRPQELP